jgi:membrane protein
VSVLAELGVRMGAISTATYVLGRLLGFAVLVVTFYGMYRGLPRRRPSAGGSLVGALVATVLFEVARELFGVVISLLAPGSLYTGSIAIVVSVVFWVYYGALLFVVGAEVAQAHELRRAATSFSSS